MREVSTYRVTSSKYLLFLVILSECWSFLIQLCIFTFLPSHFTLRFFFFSVLSTSTLPCSWARWCFVSIHFLVHFIPIFLFFSHFSLLPWPAALLVLVAVVVLVSPSRSWSRTIPLCFSSSSSLRALIFLICLFLFTFFHDFNWPITSYRERAQQFWPSVRWRTKKYEKRKIGLGSFIIIIVNCHIHAIYTAAATTSPFPSFLYLLSFIDAEGILYL